MPAGGEDDRLGLVIETKGQHGDDAALKTKAVGPWVNAANKDGISLEVELVEAAGIEPASASPLPLVLHA
jgi:hypothetical protein